MKDTAKQLRDEITRAIDNKVMNVPTFFPPELIERVAQYAREQGKKGISLLQCSQELGLSKARLHYWLYGRKNKLPAPLKPPPPPALRAVQVSSEMVPVYDGVRESRYTVRSPAGWQIGDLTLKELTELLRGLV